MIIEKRDIRTYKIRREPYEKAMARASRVGIGLATLIEQWVIAYGEGIIVKNGQITDSVIKSQ